MVIVKLVVELICLETMNEGQYPEPRTTGVCPLKHYIFNFQKNVISITYINHGK